MSLLARGRSWCSSALICVICSPKGRAQPWSRALPRAEAPQCAFPALQHPAGRREITPAKLPQSLLGAGSSVRKLGHLVLQGCSRIRGAGTPGSCWGGQGGQPRAQINKINRERNLPAVPRECLDAEGAAGAELLAQEAFPGRRGSRIAAVGCGTLQLPCGSASAPAWLFLGLSVGRGSWWPPVPGSDHCLTLPWPQDLSKAAHCIPHSGELGGI